MNTHEQLKEICEKISYEPKFYYDNLIWFHRRFSNLTKQKVNVREIIFTQKFIDDLTLYIDKQEQIHWKYDWWSIYILDNLDNPVQFLYNLIK